MRLSILSMIILSFFSFITKAQTHIEGIVTSRDSIPLPFASVSLTDSSKEIAYTYCDSLGQFRLFLKEKPVKLFLTASYLNSKSKLYEMGSTYQVGIRIMLDIDSKINQRITVVSKTPLIQRKADRIIYSIEENPTFENKSILEILKSIPRVAITGFNLGITGQGTVAVMINNHLVYLTGKDLIDYLNIFRNDITSIEVIPNPPANFDAEGGGGLININTKKGKAKGLFGDIITGLTKNSYYQNDNNINLRFRNRNLNISAGISYGIGDYKETIRQLFAFNNMAKAGWQDLAGNKNRYNYFNTGFTLEYQFRKDVILNLSLNQASFKSINNLNRRIYYQANNAVDSLGVTEGNDKTNNLTTTGNLSIHKNLKRKKGTIDISVDMLQKGSKADLQSSTFNYYANGSNLTGTDIGLFSSSNAPRNIFSFRTDFTLPGSLLKWNTSFGIKFTNFRNHSDIGYDQTVNSKSIFAGIETTDSFSYKELNAAAYFLMSKDIKQWSFKGGLRYEGTFADGEALISGKKFGESFNNLFPSLFVQYNFKESNSVGLSYSRRINRPRIWDVNPYRWYNNIYFYSVGNPGLLPAIQNNFDLSLAFWNKLFISAYYNVQDRPIISLPYTINNVVENRKENSGTIENYGISLDLGLKSFKLLQNNFNISVGSYSYKTPYVYTLPNKPLIITYQSSHNVDITSTFSASLNISAVLPGGGANIMHQSGNYKVDVAMTKMFLKNKLQLSLSLEDLFKSSSSIYTINTPDFYNTTYNYYDFRYIAINIKYKFGMELKSAKSKSGIQSNERMRL